MTDAFGTRIDTQDIIDGLRKIGALSAAVELSDDGLVLKLPKGEEQNEAGAKAFTWLRSVFSPLVAIRIEGVRAPHTASREPVFSDLRKQEVLTVALVELWPEQTDCRAPLQDLLLRLGLAPKGDAIRPDVPAADPQPLSEPAKEIRRTLSAQLSACGYALRQGDFRFISDWRAAEPVSAWDKDPGEPSPAFLLWRRPGAEHGVREAHILAATFHRGALAWLLKTLRGSAQAPEGFEVLLDGLEWGVARRPTVASRADSSPKIPILVDGDRCTSCGLCAQVCPTNYLTERGTPATDDPETCIRCFDCIEACPEDALRPAYGASSAMLASAITSRPGWLSRLRGAPGPAVPAPFPPSFLLPKPGPPERPKYVLGLAITTMQEHAAVLLKDGKIVGAVEEERLTRIRHYGWKARGGSRVALTTDPTLCVEEVFCRRSIGELLSREGLTLDDMDLIALNGLPARYRRAFSAYETDRPIPTLRAGRVVSAPHHLCHAASAYAVSGQDESWILTVDGRGDRETASLFKGSRGTLTPIDEILSLTDRSIGGVYESVTRLLGFGSHGQGSVMALASFGKPRHDMRPFLSLRTWKDFLIHESGVAEHFDSQKRPPGAALEQRHRELAASLQSALEQTMLALLKAGRVPQSPAGLCLAGGVALNCKTNGLIREAFHPEMIFVQPAANDAGTALGAAIVALGPEAPHGPAAALEHAYLGPSYGDEAIEPVLRRSGLAYRRLDDTAEETARLLSNGQVVCWFQHRMEFGPRALGARSILADPRRADMKDRINRIKDRESWRPFAPSILAGREGEWFEDAFDSRFMLFALRLKKERLDAVPAIAHKDGTTRPQSVHRGAHPLYHALIESFDRLTGVPMVLNTSFNRRGEPIVCTPRDAVACFLGMNDVDALVIGSFLATKEAPARPRAAESNAIAAKPGGRRLMLRLTTKCDLDCGHCTMRDIMGQPDRSWDGALEAITEGRKAGCDQLVLMRGEPAAWPGLPRLISQAKAMGYGYIQLQTNGRALASKPRREALFSAGLDGCEIMLAAAAEELHDRLTRTKGALKEVLMGIRAVALSDKQLLVTVPVLRDNMADLKPIASLVHALGAKNIQFSFPRPVEFPEGIMAEPLARLADASPYIREASLHAARLGLAVSTEGIPFCHLDEEFHVMPDATEDWRRFRVDDLESLQESLEPARASARPEPPVCRPCRHRETCPKTWASYQALFGTSELKPAS